MSAAGECGTGRDGTGLSLPAAALVVVVVVGRVGRKGLGAASQYCFNICNYDLQI